MQTASTGSRLSTQQTRLWQLQQERDCYRVQATYLLDGNIEEKRLKQAIRVVIGRHEILRTNFSLLPGTDIPLQIVLESEELTKLDFKRIFLTGENWQEQVAHFFAQEKEIPFHLKQGSPLRITLFTRSPQQHLMLLSLPALCGDTTTLTHLIHELCNAYTTTASDEEQPLQYADVAAWQEELLHEEDSTAHRNYWREIDTSARTSTHLAFERRVQSPEQLFDPRIFSLPIPSDLEAQIQALIQDLNVSPASFFLACWQILLWRFTDKAQSLVGVSCNGRHYEELAHALGMYTRVVPFTIPLDNEQSFDQFIHCCEETLEQVIEEQFYFTWADIQKQQTAGIDFFPVQFEFETCPATFTQGSLVVTEHQLYSCQERFTLKLLGRQLGTHIRLEIYYDASHLDTSSIQILAHAFQALLTSTAHASSASIDQLDILKADEYQTIINAFTTDSTSYPERTVTAFFEDHVEKTPDAIALICQDQQMTYHQLNISANRLAHALQQQGIGKNKLVALCMERSIEMVIGLLGIMKAGGAYVPLDPDMPLARIQYQLQDSQVTCLVTQSHLLAQIPFQAHWCGKIIFLDELALTESDETNLSSSLNLEDLAYVIYTSGSTGNPKGVAIRHRGLTNYTYFMCSALALQPGLHFATVSTLAADLGNTVIYCALTSGGCLHILTYETITDSTAFAQYFATHSIDVLKIVPSHFKALLNTQQQDSVILPRQYLILGGEILPTDLVQQIRALHGTCTIINHYGPTETTIGVLINPLPAVDTQKYTGTSIPIGKPISNTGTYILDRYLRPVPIGVTGELYIVGDGLAAGYLHQPDQTDARFIDLPFITQLNTKAYKTGDLARYTTDGLVEYIGRVDRQVKLRGYRLELEEIEMKIMQYPDVWACAVQLREDMSDSPCLIAYLVPLQTGKLSLKDLSEYLNRELPVYMLPSHFVVLDTLPLNANGKINYEKLPLPTEQPQEPRTAYSAARSPIEEILLSIWQEFLSVPHLGIHDNFFQAGGHSLIATQIISRIRLTMSIELPILCLFEAPTIAEFAILVEQAMHNGQMVNIPPIPIVDRTEPIPLSFAQQRLWFLDQFEPDSRSYNKPVALRLTGKLNREALLQSLHEIVQRHEILRTTFQEIQNQPVQIIHEASSFQVEQHDLSTFSQYEQEIQLQQYIYQEASYRFDLAHGPLLHVKLLHMSQDDHILLISMHHIISDGWSNAIMIQDLTTLYTAYCAQRPSPPVALPIQYADFAVWQQQWLQGPILQEQLTYWCQQLQHPPILELPLDRPRPVVQTSSGSEEKIFLSASLSESLKVLSQREGVTLFITLLAAFNVLLKHYSGQDDILVGTPVANRNRGEIEKLIGFFVNTLVLRTDLSGNPPFTTLLQRVRKVALEAYTHQDMPFEKLVEALQLERDLSRSPLFQVMFIMQNVPMPSETFADLTLSLVDNENKTAMFDLTLTVMESAQGLHAVARYNTDLFDRETIQYLLTHWQILLQAIVQDPTQRIDTLTFITPTEQQQLASWNQTIGAVPETSIHRLFELQVEQQPDRIAIAFEEQQVSYRELNRRANQLAHALLEQGIQIDTPVGLCVERSIEMVIGVLSILKAGGAYVPLDPAYPQERLSYMIQDSQIQTVLTQTSLLGILPSALSNTICLDTQDEIPGKAPYNNPALPILPDNLAYIIYTSGSTGLPKGIAMPHRTLLNLLHWQSEHSSSAQKGRTLQFTSLSFDVAFQELFSTWYAGGTLYLVTEFQRQDVIALTRLLHEQNIERIFLPFVALQQIAQEIVHSKFLPLSLREVITAGERLQITDSIRQTFRDLPSCSLQNQYGPAETHVVTAHTLEADANNWSIYPSIGRPIANIQVYILNEHLEQVPIGVSGEIYLAGLSLARGYFHKPDMTAERFLPNPFGPIGSRLYKTGDLARYRRDGMIEFLGRADHQVKVRGYRIELGEIEHVLLQHPLVAEGVVVVREIASDEKRLVAYVVPKAPPSEEGSTPQQCEVLVRQLRQHLQDKLPDYMHPAAYVQLPALPMTPSGKIDRRSLPAPETVGTGMAERQMKPYSQTEELMITLWSNILGQPHIGIHDNFFELGGHSLLATRLISRIRASFGIELPLRALFEAPTIARLTAKIEQARRDEPGVELPPLVPVDRTHPLPLSFAQQRLWFLYQLEPESSSYLMPTAVRIQGPLHVSIFIHCLQEMVHRHESFRTSFLSSAGVPAQVIAADMQLEIPLIDLLHLSQEEKDAEVSKRIRIEATHPFDLSRGPLLRAILLVLGEQDHVLLLTMHHIISDGWSLGIFSRELLLLYQAALAHQPAQLPEQVLHYADFAVWQRQWLSDTLLQQHIAYWKTQLDGAPALLKLPTDHPRTSTRNGKGAFCNQTLPESLAEAIKIWSRQHDVTLFMTLLTALNLVLYHWTSQTDIVIGTVVANRTKEETEQMIGCFMNFFALRSQLRDTQTGVDLLAEVKATTLDAYAHQDCPFEKLVEALQPERQHYHNPFYNVALLLQNFPWEMPTDHALCFTPMLTEAQEALLDLRIVVREQAEGLTIRCEYDTDLFEMETIQQFLSAYISFLEQLIQRPDQQLATFALPQPLIDQAQRSQRREQKQAMLISATFTADPLAEVLTYWVKELKFPLDVSFVSYNQVFQQLLDPSSQLRQNQAGINIILIRLEDWLRPEQQQAFSEDVQSQIERTLDELVSALRDAGQQSSSPYLLCLCPPSPRFAAITQKTSLAALEQQFIEQVASLPQVYLLKSTEISELYPVQDFYDPYGDKNGHIPFTSLFFVALGTSLIRKIHALHSTPYKVIVLDCDNTLWQGVSAEDGITSIVIDPARRMVQEFLLSQQQAGMLLCLCSKNNEEDVLSIFTNHPDMVLRKEHLTTWRINWKAKSQNLWEIADELQLSLDSFILIDDNPLECAEVNASCPEVLTIPATHDSQQLIHLLKHIWAFDHINITEEDKRRTILYQQQQQRQAFMKTSLSLRDFLEGLQLQVHIAPMSPSELGRVAQLTLRTNQFNNTTIRRSEHEIQLFCRQHERTATGGCLVVNVQDRFGDYGLVGVMFYQNQGQAIQVETILLSCRVLGRGVEHRMLAYVGNLARQQGITRVYVPYIATQRNTPMYAFLENIGASYKHHSQQHEWFFDFPATYLAELTYQPADEVDHKELLSTPEKQLGQKGKQRRLSAHQFLRIAETHDTAERILSALAIQRKAVLTQPHTALEPRTPLEEHLQEIWSDVLRLSPIGIHENFFALGGHSLLATQLLSRIMKVFQVELPLRLIFEASTIAEQAQLLTEIMSQHQQLQVPPIVPATRIQPILLSFAQQRLWFLDRLEPESAAYNIPGAVRLRGSLHIQALEQSLYEIIQRHEALRTTITEIAGQAVQNITTGQHFSLGQIDLQGLSPEKQHQTVQQIMQEEAAMPFDLTHDILLRAKLLIIAEQEYILLLTMHHIVSDGWSYHVFLRELQTIYHAFCEQKPSPLARLPIQYADFAVWQRQWLQGAVLQQQLAYWQQQLANAPLLNLPTDHPRPPVQTSRGERFITYLPLSLTEQLKVVSQREGVTLFMTLLAAFLVLLKRYSGQEDILVGTPVANRNRRELEDLIGFFVNTLVLRTDLSGNPTFSTLLQRVRQVALQAYTHQDIPFEKLVEALQPERDLSHTPFFQVMFILQNTPAQMESLAGLELQTLEIDNKTARFDITLSLTETQRGLRCMTEYNTDLFESETMHRFIGHWQQIIQCIVERTEQTIDSFPLLTSSEQLQLATWNATAKDVSSRCMHELFEEQVKRAPDKIALVLDDEHISYAKLNQRANQLAHYLQRLGIHPDTLVGLCMERASLNTAISLLGILKAGGAYMPLDPAYPKERLTFMLENAQVDIVLTQTAQYDALPATSARYICLDTQWKEIASQSEASPMQHTALDNLAYAIYTSGSTGQPKGVQVPHRGIGNLVAAQQLELGVLPHYRVLQFASLSFDASVFEYVMALLTGATLCLAISDKLLPDKDLIHLLQEQAITIVTLPPSALAVLPQEALPDLQAIVVAGEACPLETAQHWSKGRRFFNAYGPTEATIWTSVAFCSPESKRIHIGGPISNTQIYLLDASGQQVPVGVIGEIYIGGVGLARGYVQRPELTAERFVPHPYSHIPGNRLYRTGDLARYLLDGTIEFLGRIDSQVKVRGYRIELEEIELALMGHPSIQQCVATIETDDTKHKRIVAYLTGTPSQDMSTVEEIHQFLRGKLPEYMLPSRFYQVETFPLLPNGKIDRKTLTRLQCNTLQPQSELVSPRTAIEELLVDIWKQVLHVETVSIDDNFFSLGGDSILSLQIVARARTAGLQISVRDIFAHPTIAQLSSIVHQEQMQYPEHIPVTGDVPLIPVQHWFFEQQIVQRHQWNQARLLEIASPIETQRMQRLLQMILSNHDTLRLRFEQATTGEWRAFYGNEHNICSFSSINLAHLSWPQQQQAIMEHSQALQQSFDLLHGPLAGAILFNLGENCNQRLLLVIHHLLVDSLSWRILLEDLSQAYDQFQQEGLPRKTSSFQTWTQKLVEYAQSDTIAAECDYWLALKEHPYASLPIDHEYRDNTVGSAQTLYTELDEATTHTLLHDMQTMYHTQINEVLLTALTVGFCRWSGQKALWLDLEGHGREELFPEVDLSHTVGWFTTLYPFFFSPTLSSVEETLLELKEALRRIPQRGLGFGILRYLHPDRQIRQQLASLPHPEMSFNYLGQFDQPHTGASQFLPAQESVGYLRHPQGQRTHLLEINSSIVQGKLQWSWTYSEHVHTRQNIRHLTEHCMGVLREICTICHKTTATRFTPSDFSLLNLDRNQLDRLINRVMEANEE